MERWQRSHTPPKRGPCDRENYARCFCPRPVFVDVRGCVLRGVASRKDSLSLDHNNQPLSLRSMLVLRGRSLQFEGAMPIIGHFQVMQPETGAFVATRPSVRLAKAASKPGLELFFSSTHSTPSLVVSVIYSCAPSFSLSLTLGSIYSFTHLMSAFYIQDTLLGSMHNRVNPF